MTASLDTDLAARVTAGATLLDQHNPDWHNHIDLDHLDQGRDWDCILGQLYGAFVHGTRELGISHKRADGDTVNHGFDLDDLTDEPFHALTAAWKHEVRARREDE